MRTGSTLLIQPPDGLEPLGAFNQPVYKHHSQIRAALSSRLGPDFANVFARPDIDPAGQQIGWIAAVPGEPRRWIDLPPAEQARLEPVKQAFHARLAAYQQELSEADEASPNFNFSRVLGQALRVPGPEYLYFVDDKPVMAFWGFKRVGIADGIEPLLLPPQPIRLQAPPAAEAALKAAAALRPRPWCRRWWWLLLLLLLLLLLALWWWLMPALGPRPLVLAPWLPGAPESLAPPPDSRGPLLPDRPAAQLPETVVPGRPGVAIGPGGVVEGGRVVVGPGGALVPGPELPVPAVPPGGADSPALQPGTPPVTPLSPGADPATPEHAPVRPDAAPPTAADPTVPPGARPPGLIPPGTLPPGTLPPGALPPADRGPPPGKPLALPDNARPGPAGFMEGQWHSRSGLRDSQNRPLEQSYEFDKSGQGQVVIRGQNGRECRAKVEAITGPDGKLVITEGKTLICNDGSTMAGATTTCAKGADGKVACQGTNSSNGSHFQVRMDQGGR
ncbi:MAG: SrfA family protein [Rhodospirillaceae bacterium]